jgi:hypothetical protein
MTSGAKGLQRSKGLQGQGGYKALRKGFNIRYFKNLRASNLTADLASNLIGEPRRLRKQ